MDIQSFRTEGLGDATYLLTHAGRGLLVDPQRDIERFLRAAADADVELRWVLETHLHNDYVSGGRAAAARSGAELVMPASAVVPYAHTPAFHREEIGDGPLRLRPIHTPGHTPEHTSYLVIIEGEPVAVFTGGSLLVGSAGRSDLLGWDRAEQLARAQHASVHRLAELPDAVGVYPTHGEGSFCTASGAGRTTSTIGEERASNPVLAYPDVEAFVAGELSGLQPFPRYYAFMGPINLRGPEPMPAVDVPELSVEELADLEADVAIVDARPRAAIAAAHLPGAWSVELSAQLGVWLGWLLPFNAPLVVVCDVEQDAAEAVTQLARIGFDDVRGIFREMDTWVLQGRTVRSFDLIDLDAFVEAVAHGAQVLDVRAPDEHDAVALDGAIHRYLPDLVDDPPAELDADRPVLVACATGYRATIAAGILVHGGYDPIVLDGAGVPEAVTALRSLGQHTPA